MFSLSSDGILDQPHHAATGTNVWEEGVALRVGAVFVQPASSGDAS
ncbi:hypothetical protein ACFU6I_42340 [Streptomyces sp. NPDC057486]